MAIGHRLKSIKGWITALALIGALLMLYLTYLHFSGTTSTVCDFSAELSCQIVNQSVFSEILGIPISLLGFIYFIGVIALLNQKKIKKQFRLILLLTLFSLVYSLSLSSIEIFLLASICLFCEISKVIMAAIFGLSIAGVYKNKEKLPALWVIGAILIGLLYSWVAFSLQTKPTVTRDYTSIAQCLTEKGVAMYSAFWCPKCAKQKKLFGNAFEFIDEIECDPRGKDSQTERCIEKKISKTPTWLWEKDGEEIKRITGAQPIEDLALFFECPVE